METDKAACHATFEPDTLKGRRNTRHHGTSGHFSSAWLMRRTQQRIQLAGQEQRATNEEWDHRQRERRLQREKGTQINQEEFRWGETLRTPVMFTSACLGGDLFICLSGGSLGLLLALCQLFPRQPHIRAANSTLSRVSLRCAGAILSHITLLQTVHPSTATDRFHKGTQNWPRCYWFIQ